MNSNAKRVPKNISKETPVIKPTYFCKWNLWYITYETTPAVKQEDEELRVPLQVDIDEAQENDMRKELAYNMPLEVIEAIINAQKEAAREQMRIAELETEAPTEIANRSAPVQTNPPSLATRKK